MSSIKREDYKDVYKQYYGIDFGWDMAIHHIDYDHSNNSIDNLLLLPRELHSSYHTIMSHLGGSGTGQIAKVLLVNRKFGESDKSKCFRTLANVLDDIKPWISFKMKLDNSKKYSVGQFPPLHAASTTIYGLIEYCLEGNTLVIGAKANSTHTVRQKLELLTKGGC